MQIQQPLNNEKIIQITIQEPKLQSLLLDKQINGIRMPIIRNAQLKKPNINARIQQNILLDVDVQPQSPPVA